MDFKKMLMDMAQVQADKMQEEAMGFLASDEFADKIATKINQKIDIPFVLKKKNRSFLKELLILLQI